MLETLKRGVTQLTKIRHPQVLIVQHPLEESRDTLAFATEPVFASLANILGNATNMPSPIPNGIANYKLFDVEIKYGIIQLSEGLSFLHTDVKLLHRNICPESIVINNQGAWKIFGFDFCVLNKTPHEATPHWPLPDYNPSWNVLTQPPLEYMAPECALTSSHSPASDIYSMGMLLYALHALSGKPMRQFGKDFGAFKRFSNELKQGKIPSLSCVPDGLREYVKMMLNASPEIRPDIHQLTKVAYFDDVGVKALSYLDSLFQWDNLQKSKFYKGLPQIIQKLPHRISMFRILPCLTKEFVNPPMVPFVLPNVLLIAEKCTPKDFSKHILPSLKPVMKITDPIQILLIFMQKMELLLKLTSAEDVKSDVLPMLYRALESDAQQIQELCLSVLPTFASLIDYPAMKNALLPRIKKLCINTPYVSVRVNCLLCIGKLLEHLDKWLVLDEIIPFLPQIPSREPAVLMGILGIYKLALNHNKLGLTKEVMATKVIPFLVPLCIENGLTLNQFNALVSLVKDMFNRVETEHKTKLEQLNSIQKDAKTLDQNFQSAIGPLTAAPTQSNSDFDKMMSSLGMDNYGENGSVGSSGANVSINAGNNNYDDFMSIKTDGLSMEDKLRIVREKEQMQRMKNQPSIIAPIASPPQSTIAKPKDLTATLIDNNLKQMVPSQWNNNFSTDSTGASGGSAWHQTTSLTSPIGGGATGNGSAAHGFAQWTSATSTPQNYASMAATQQNQINQNWSAFDNLLPTNSSMAVSNRQAITMGSGLGGSTSNGGQTINLLQSNNNRNATGGNKKDTMLSTQEIMDFLNN